MSLLPFCVLLEVGSAISYAMDFTRVLPAAFTDTHLQTHTQISSTWGWEVSFVHCCILAPRTVPGFGVSHLKMPFLCGSKIVKCQYLVGSVCILGALFTD